MPSIPEMDLVEKGFEDTFQKLYEIFYQAWIAASDDAGRTDAEKRFENGLAAARTVRDRAASIVVATIKARAAAAKAKPKS